MADLHYYELLYVLGERQVFGIFRFSASEEINVSFVNSPSISALRNLYCLVSYGQVTAYPVRALSGQVCKISQYSSTDPAILKRV